MLRIRIVRTAVDLTLLLVFALCGAAWAADPGSGLSLTQAFVSGTNGYDTYRIPALVAARNGTLLAFCEGRRNSRSEAGDKQPYERLAFACFDRDWLTSVNTDP